MAIHSNSASAIGWGLQDRDAEIEIIPAERSTLADILAQGDTFKYDYVLGEDWSIRCGSKYGPPRSPT